MYRATRVRYYIRRETMTSRGLCEAFPIEIFARVIERDGYTGSSCLFADFYDRIPSNFDISEEILWNSDRRSFTTMETLEGYDTLTRILETSLIESSRRTAASLFTIVIHEGMCREYRKRVRVTEIVTRNACKSMSLGFTSVFAKLYRPRLETYQSWPS